MTTKDDGGPAFPRVPFDVNDYCGDGSPGMTLRDWFAGQALAGMLGDSEVTADPNTLARVSYAYADGMLAARKGGAA